MRTGEFAAPQWIERLAGALAELAEIHKRYQDELDQIESELSQGRGADNPSDAFALFDFSSRACVRKERDDAGEYGPLCNALAEVRSVLAAHPALAEARSESLVHQTRDDIWIQILSHGYRGSLSSMIASLMARGVELSGDGFRRAAAELDGVLAPRENLERSPRPDDLSVGYHVVLFHGLRVAEHVPLAGDMALLPFEQWGPFVDERILQDFAPALIRENLRQSVGALVKPFRWTPTFRQRRGVIDPVLDGGRAFFTEAQAFVELLALFHAAPVICLALLPYCIHRTASFLLGGSHYNGGYQWGHSARSFDCLAESTELSRAALTNASAAFAARQSATSQHCAPIVARLTEALARSGRFQADDKILDVAIALERLYELEGGEISFKLKARAACFLETSTERRIRVFQDVEQLSKARSAIVHKQQSKKWSAVEAKHEAFTKGFAVARRSVVKLLQEGLPADWHTLVLAGTEPSAPEPGDGNGPA